MYLLDHFFGLYLLWTVSPLGVPGKPPWRSPKLVRVLNCLKYGNYCHHITYLGLRLSSPEKIAVRARAEITENIMNDRSMEGNSFENKTLLSVGVENTYRTRQNASRHKRKCGNRSECIYKALDVDIQVSILKIEPESSFFKTVLQIEYGLFVRFPKPETSRSELCTLNQSTI